jgi:DNA-binding CsgD family transcriptional regulator
MNALLRLEAESLELDVRRGRREGDRTAAVLDLLRASDTPAVVSDMAGHVLLWNTAAEKLLRRPSHEALGRLCHDLLAGRDVFGNRYCHDDCAVRAMCRRGESVQPFEIVVDTPRPSTALQVSILKVPGTPPEKAVIVHLLQPLDREGRLAREMERLGVASPRATAPARDSRPAADDPGAPLTPRERDVLGRMAEGLQNKEIAQKLDISLATVRNHVHNLLEKLGVHSKLEAISMAYRAGWVASPKPTRERGSRPGRAVRPRD